MPGIDFTVNFADQLLVRTGDGEFVASGEKLSTSNGDARDHGRFKAKVKRKKAKGKRVKDPS